MKSEAGDRNGHVVELLERIDRNTKHG
jgi:hypothetical protein